MFFFFLKQTVNKNDFFLRKYTHFSFVDFILIFIIQYILCGVVDVYNFEITGTGTGYYP